MTFGTWFAFRNTCGRPRQRLPCWRLRHEPVKNLNLRGLLCVACLPFTSLNRCVHCTCLCLLSHRSKDKGGRHRMLQAPVRVPLCV